MASGRHSDVIEHMRKYQGINAPIVSVSAMLWRPVFTVRLLLVVRRQISHRHTGTLETPKAISDTSGVVCHSYTSVLSCAITRGVGDEPRKRFQI